ncbi:MAG TPA: DUF485 domain-containing protein [Longimicrobium sp.]|jgi:uncharacterized membrane protein (DUF485 family)
MPGPPPSGSTPPARDEAWARLESEPEFRALVAAKRRFIVPATVFFVVYYFALPVLVAYFPDMMGRDVVGNVNIAYLFALSQFFMAWILMAMYIRRARDFDAQAAKIAAGSTLGGDR